MKITPTAVEILRISLEYEQWRSVREFAGDNATPAETERARRAVNSLTRQGLLCQRIRNGRAEWNRALDSDKFRTAVQILLQHSKQPA